MRAGRGKSFGQSRMLHLNHLKSFLSLSLKRQLNRREEKTCKKRLILRKHQIEGLSRFPPEMKKKSQRQRFKERREKRPVVVVIVAACVRKKKCWSIACR